MHNFEKKTNWNVIYDERHDSGGWDYLSAIIIQVLIKEFKCLKEKKILDAGCGSGRNSLELSKFDAKCFLLDKSYFILKQNIQKFKNNLSKTNFVNACIFNIPFKSCSFDFVWNAGVIEHWTGEDQKNILKEMLRVCKKDGIVVTLNPYYNSWLFSIGKKIFLKFNLFPYTDEISVKKLKYQIEKIKGYLVKKEYSIGFFVLFAGCFLFLSKDKKYKIFFSIFQFLNIFFTKINKTKFGIILRYLDSFFSKIFGGYLLVSVFKHKS